MRFLGALSLLSLATSLALSASLSPIALQVGTAPPMRALNSTVRGVSLGGWLLLEQWITPPLFRQGGVDEWTLSARLGKTATLRLLQQHWSMFITRDDFQQMKAAGLNSVRIPLPYWAVDVLDYEPYVQGQYPYLIQAVNICRELGISVLIDLHGHPGSQNGQDHSGLIGPVRFATNATNAQRSINVLRNLTQEFSRPEYGGAVYAIELMNEPAITDSVFTMAQLKSFYSNATEAIRSASSSGIQVMIHDAFWGLNYWRNYDPLSSSASVSPSYLALDAHLYFAFAPFNNLPENTILDHVCNSSLLLKNNRSGIASSFVGEWSLETGQPPNSTVNSRGLTTAKRTWLRKLFEAQLAAYSPNGQSTNQPSKGFYFWCWKTTYGIDTWDYQRGLSEGYIPSDLRNASLLAYPILDNGCIDGGFAYTPPARGSGATPRTLASNFSLPFYTVPLLFLLSSLC